MALWASGKDVLTLPSFQILEPCARRAIPGCTPSLPQTRPRPLSFLVFCGMLAVLPTHPHVSHLSTQPHLQRAALKPGEVPPPQLPSLQRPSNGLGNLRGARLGKAPGDWRGELWQSDSLGTQATVMPARKLELLSQKREQSLTRAWVKRVLASTQAFPHLEHHLEGSGRASSAMRCVPLVGSLD